MKVFPFLVAFLRGAKVFFVTIVVVVLFALSAKKSSKLNRMLAKRLVRLWTCLKSRSCAEKTGESHAASPKKKAVRSKLSSKHTSFVLVHVVA
jgi:hypothetical protein